ncbi:MAG: hypothetical protein Kow0069_03100 [Promethearchaeota archaeon]
MHAEELSGLAAAYNAVHEALEENRHFHSTPLIVQRVVLEGETDDETRGSADSTAPELVLQYDLADFFLLGAVAGANLLLTGGTGEGKTRLAKIATSAIFGSDGVAFKRVNSEMTTADFLDTDLERLRSLSGRSSEVTLPGTLLTKPAVIFDEANRATPLVQNVMLGVLDGEVNLPNGGATLRSGKDGYQFFVLTINEGNGFAGVAEFDRAIRDRSTLEVPVDHYPPTLSDLLDVLETGRKMLDVVPRDGHFREVRALADQRGVPISEEAELFLLFLANHDRCSKVGPTRNKRAVRFNPDLCRGCHALPNHSSYYQHVLAPSTRALDRLKDVAAKFPLLRALKVAEALAAGRGGGDQRARELFAVHVESLKVELDDVVQLAPFVLFNKVSVNPNWVAKEFAGSTFEATRSFVREAHIRFLEFLTEWGGAWQEGLMDEVPDPSLAGLDGGRKLGGTLEDWREVREEMLEANPEFDVFTKLREVLATRSRGRQRRARGIPPRWLRG